ncbi:SDR family NAD(P)-dependent oxidoreductase [Thermophagus sp. OGC60D27]|uniref:SDR family NAD(P)-dependent oxidoreductase n=1 Tax=Thermophagus sp. OGC60D27 TaxID=3458415 RepID=UPI00403775C7
MNQLTNLIAAIRMKSSGERLASARFFSDPKWSTKEEAIEAGWPANKITEISPDTSIDDLKPITLSTEGNIIILRDNGYILTAPSAKAIERINKKRSFDEPLQQPTGRMSGKSVVVTGAAQGFGQGIAESFFAEGANVVIADLNDQKGPQLADSLNNSDGANSALFVKCDVSKAQSVEQMVQTATFHFGGIDTFISNAGILRAGGLDEMDPEIFELMTKVNYSGFFHCAKAASAIMKIQTEVKPDYFADILQINSKSGLKGSNKNFAYAGAKFGGIGLTQSFALELMPARIKVNAICPGNFFEGPLWSDPQKGLFVQYLLAGKVPGAKTTEDVKRHYEAQVPAGRGCRVKDVVKAIFYAIEQEYETGQAIPVTGGQNMLS